MCIKGSARRSFARHRNLALNRDSKRDKKNLSLVIGSLLISALLLAFVQCTSYTDEEYTGAGNDRASIEGFVRHSIVMLISTIYLHSAILEEEV